MLGQLPGQQQPHGGLHLPAGDGGSLVVLRQARRLRGDALEEVVHEGVHDAHGFARDAGVGVDLGEKKNKKQFSRKTFYWDETV